MGRPIGSKWCITFIDANICALGEEGTVVGFSQEHSQVEVKFRNGLFHIAEGQLITSAAWQDCLVVALSNATHHHTAN